MKIHEYNEMMAYLTRPAMAYGGRIGFGAGGQANREKSIQEAIEEFGLEALDEGAKKLGYDNYRSMVGGASGGDAAKVRKHLKKYGRVITESEARLLGRKQKTATDRAATPTKGARIVKGNYTRDYNMLELKNLAEDDLFDPYKNGGTFAEGVPEKKLVKDRIVDLNFLIPKQRKNFLKILKKDFNMLEEAVKLKN